MDFENDILSSEETSVSSINSKRKNKCSIALTTKRISFEGQRFEDRGGKFFLLKDRSKREFELKDFIMMSTDKPKDLSFLAYIAYIISAVLFVLFTEFFVNFASLFSSFVIGVFLFLYFGVLLFITLDTFSAIKSPFFVLKLVFKSETIIINYNIFNKSELEQFRSILTSTVDDAHANLGIKEEISILSDRKLELEASQNHDYFLQKFKLQFLYSLLLVSFVAFGIWHGNFFGTSLSVLQDIEFIEYENTIIITKYTGLSSEIDIPSNIGGIPVVIIGTNSFSNSWLQTVSVPGSVETISTGAFSNSSRLTTVLLSEGVRSIGLDAFSDCPVLQTVIIPDSVTFIDDEAFGYIISSNNLTIICSENSYAHQYSVNQGIHFILR